MNCSLVADRPGGVLPPGRAQPEPAALPNIGDLGADALDDGLGHRDIAEIGGHRLTIRERPGDEVAQGGTDPLVAVLADGQEMAADLGYIPMPKTVVERVRADIPNIR